MVCALIFLAVFLVPLIFISVLFLIRWLEKELLPNLSSKSVLVTGCDSGFGFELTLRLLKHGIRVFAGCYSEKGGKELEVAGKELMGHLQTIQLDITSQNSVEDAFDQVQKVLEKDGGMHLLCDGLMEPGLWGLVNNAGIKGWSGPDDFLQPQDYIQTFQVNCVGAIRMCQVFKPLVKTAQGRIVNMISVAGRLAFSSIGPYCVSKFALEAYSDCLRLEMKPFGVSVHILEPEMFKTSMSQAFPEDWERSWDRASQATKKEYGVEYKYKQSELWKIECAGSRKDTHLVIDAYFHALMARFPRRHYWIGNASMQLIATAPTSIQDYILSKGLLVPQACRNMSKNN